MLPVFDGKCWVKQDGRWGVIELLGEDPGQKTENETSQEKKKNPYCCFVSADSCTCCGGGYVLSVSSCIFKE